MFRRSLLCLVLLLLACVHRVESPTARLEEAASAASGPTATARTLALSGFHAWLMQNDVAQAQARFDAALTKDARDPYALYGQAMLKLRAARPDGAVAASLDLCERAPKHPLCTAAARLVFDIAGTATSIDALIVARAPGILAAGAPGDASALLRSALANIHLSRREGAQHDAVLAAEGVPRTFTVMGPFSVYHLLDLEQPTAPEKDGNVRGGLTGPFGTVEPREMHFADGRFSLSGEPPSGDVYLLAVDLEVKQRGAYEVRTVSAMDHAAVLDGTPLFLRRTWERPASSVTSAAVNLEPGKHRLMIRAAHDEQQGHLYLSVGRLDGAPSEITFTPARGAAAKWSADAVKVLPLPQPGLYASAASFAEALEPEAGAALAALVAARDSLSRDREGAKAQLYRLPEGFGGPALRLLWAQLSLLDHTVPQKVAKGRATRDLEAALELDKGNVAALLDSAQLALDDSRAIDAMDVLAQARALGPPPAPLLLLKSRAELALGVDAQADATAKEALKALDGLCDALLLRYDLASRRDAVADSDAALDALRTCPNTLAREAEAYKSRGQLERAAKLYEQLLAEDESHVPSVSSLTNLYVSQRRFDDAVKLVTRSAALWPRNAALMRLLADVHEAAGHADEALKAREKALALDGGDLATRRIVERSKTGKEVLYDHAISTDEALKAYAAAPGEEDAPGAYVLDAAAVRVYPDGSMVDRIHIIQKVLDQSGIQDVAEVEVPQGATLLKMRTIKPDGRVLEPESIEGKDSISLPGVEVGDFVEYEYLLAHSARGPAQPGFTSASFYFQIARQPNNWSTYTVVAPKGSGMKVDSHNLKAMAPQVQGDEEVFFHEERRVPPYIPEPNGPPTGNEWLPFVSIGAGQQGNDGTVAAYADAFIDEAQITTEVERFARDAVKGLTGRAAVLALYTAVMQKLSGHDAGLQASAAASVAQDRGSRLMLLYAGLKAAGLPTRLAVVRTFNADPAPYLFPQESLLPYLCLRVELPAPEGGFVWLDPVFRYGPFGELPDVASDREALLLPEPGHPLQKARTPVSHAPTGKTIGLKLSLSSDGELTGEGTETYLGFGAAQLAEALDSIPPDQREQALQSALSRYFGGAQLSKLELDMKREVGAPVVVRYAFKAPRFARAEGKTLVFSQATFPALLGRRYLQLGSRRTPLFLDSVEESQTQATLTLPDGYTLSGALPDVKVECPYGKFERHEKAVGTQVTIAEKYHVDMARVPPKDYERFGAFAGEIDLVQGREMLAETK
jgi:tetratricopeptide (TPR) repeat protein